MRPRRSPLWKGKVAGGCRVSILVVLECALEGRRPAHKPVSILRFQSLLFWNAPSKSAWRRTKSGSYSVSILVVLECALEGHPPPHRIWPSRCFNPCCFGMRPRRYCFGQHRSWEGQFQSLLFWNAPSKFNLFKLFCYLDFMFQSLLFWNAPSKMNSILTTTET